MKKGTFLATALLLGTAFSGMPMISHARAHKLQQNEPKSRQNLIREVRHQLVLLPYYSVFDNLAFRVEGDTVILEGQVVRPTLKSDAENVVKNIEGVGQGGEQHRGAAAIADGRPDSQSGVPRDFRRSGTVKVCRIGCSLDSHHREKRKCYFGGSGG